MSMFNVHPKGVPFSIPVVSVSLKLPLEFPGTGSNRFFYLLKATGLAGPMPTFWTTMQHTDKIFPFSITFNNSMVFDSIILYHYSASNNNCNCEFI